MTVKITELTDGHVSSLHALLMAEEMGYHAQSLLDQPRRYEKLYVAVLDEQVVGFLEGTLIDMEVFASGELPPPRARIMNLLVSSQHRRNKIGSALVQRFVVDAQAALRGSLVLFPERHEAEGRTAFFTACGLHPVETTELLGAPLETIRIALA
ncbi:GNAT family N-acetyltransferase [Streptomyces sp. NPDC005141]